MKVVLIYHKEDNDGVISAALIYNHLKSININDITLIGCDYNEMNKLSIDYIKSFDYLIITDISFNNDTMIDLYDYFEQNFVWFDHHKPKIDESNRMNYYSINGIRNTNHSAILNAYEYYYNPLNIQKIPELLRILSAYDSWTYQQEGYTLEYVTIINQAITSEFNLNIYDVIDNISLFFIQENDNTLFTIHDKGYTIVKENERTNERLISQYGDFSFKVNNKVACALFIQGQSSSQMFKCCSKRVNHGIVFKHLINDNWTMSLYNTREDIDFHCGEYLKEKYGGGGHKGAAGCQLTKEQFIEILNTHSI